MLRPILTIALASYVAAFVPLTYSTGKLLTGGLVSSKSIPTNLQTSSTIVASTLAEAELPQKIYFKKEIPKVLGGLQIGLRKIVVITGASSGLGLNCAATLAKTGRYFVIMACRDTEKAKRGERESKILLFLALFYLSIFNNLIFSCKGNEHARRIISTDEVRASFTSISSRLCCQPEGLQISSTS
jgi:hypothetical protein